MGAEDSVMAVGEGRLCCRGFKGIEGIGRKSEFYVRKI